MKIALIGLSNSGKTTIFNALTGKNFATTIYPTTTGEPNISVVKVPDSRIDKLYEIFKPKKTTYATVECIDYIGITKGDTQQNRKVFDLIKDVDSVVHVVRAFEDDSVAHPMGNVDTVRDFEIVRLELIFKDLELVEKRLERIDQFAKKGKKPDEVERKLLLKCKDALEREIPLRDVDFTEEEKNAMRHLQFVSTKPEVVVLNIGEDALNTDKEKTLLSFIPHQSVISLCGKIEMEISRLSPTDAKPFFDLLGIKEAAVNKLIRLCYKTLGLISFFTYAGDEVRSWTIKKGTTALKAAGKIHSDIERGFIKAEVVSFDDLISLGSIHAVREKGLLRLEGKTYEVKDGDIINFRFHV